MQELRFLWQRPKPDAVGLFEYGTLRVLLKEHLLLLFSSECLVVNSTWMTVGSIYEAAVIRAFITMMATTRCERSDKVLPEKQPMYYGITRHLRVFHLSDVQCGTAYAWKCYVIHTGYGGDIHDEKIDHRKMGRSCLGWWDSWFRFLPWWNITTENMVLRAAWVVNEDSRITASYLALNHRTGYKIITMWIEGSWPIYSTQNEFQHQTWEVDSMSRWVPVPSAEKTTWEQYYGLVSNLDLPDRSGYTPQWWEARIPAENTAKRLLRIS